MDTKKEFAFDFIQPAPTPARSQQQQPKQQSKSRSKDAPTTTTLAHDAITVTPAQVETQQQQQQQEREQRISKARAMMQQQEQREPVAAGASMARESSGVYVTDAGSGMDMGMDAALTPLDYERGGPQTTPDIERQIEILKQAFEQGESVPVIAKRYGISRQAIQVYISQTKDEVETNSQMLDLKLVEVFGDKLQQIALAINKDKLDKAGVRDLAIAAGILADKRKDLLGPKQTGSSTSFRIAWQGGEGAVEIKTE